MRWRRLAVRIALYLVAANVATFAVMGALFFFADAAAFPDSAGAGLVALNSLLNGVMICACVVMFGIAFRACFEIPELTRDL